MISIPVDFTGAFLAKEMNKQTTAFGIKLGVWIIGGLLGVSGILIGVIYQDITGKLLSIDTTISSISISQKTQGELLARLDERTKSLDHRTEVLERPHYESKAKALGFKNAEIVTTGLGVNAKFESKTLGPTGEYFIQYTVLAYDPSMSIIRLRFDAQLPNGMKFKDNTLIINMQSGEAEELTHYFIQTGVPKIYLQVLNVPVRDQAILAIGPKPDEAGKRS